MVNLSCIIDHHSLLDAVVSSPVDPVWNLVTSHSESPVNINY